MNFRKLGTKKIELQVTVEERVEDGEPVNRYTIPRNASYKLTDSARKSLQVMVEHQYGEANENSLGPICNVEITPDSVSVADRWKV